MHSCRFIFILIISSIIPLSGAFTQSSDPETLFRFTYLTSDDGLSQNTVDCILKDSRGFMWFGTWNGLNRYDGYSFRIYKRDDSPASLSNNFVYSICEDKQGNIWAGTRYGLNMLDFEKDRFINFIQDSNQPGSISGNWINTVYCDPEGTIWVGTNGEGLNKYSVDTAGQNAHFIHYRSDKSGPLRLGSNTVNCIYTDSKNRYWIGTDNGLTLYYPVIDTSIIFQNSFQDINSLTSNEIRCIYEDRNGHVWIGTVFGLNRWVENEGNFIRYFESIEDPHSLSHSNINSIAEDQEGKLYFATLGGVDLYNHQTDNFSHLPAYGIQNQSLNNEFINSIFCDESGLVWIGTEKGGINRFNIYQKQFRYFSAEEEIGIQLNHNTVNSILDEKESLWVGTAGGGLNQIDKTTREVKYYTYHSRDPSSLISNFVTSLCRDTKGRLWIGTWGGGFSEFISAKGRGQFRHNMHDTENENSLINDFVSTVYQDQNRRLWIGTEGGLDLFDPQENSFTHVLNQPENGQALSEVGCILLDSDNNLWVGTRNGLFFIASENLQNLDKNPNGIPYHLFINDPEVSESLNENYVISIFEDSQGNLWIGTYGNGLNKLVWDGIDPKQVKFKHYTQADGLSNNVVYAIEEDDSNQLWLSTDYGLTRFNTISEKFSTYFVADGLQSNQFYWNASARGIDGVLYFGGMKGVNYFKPEHIKNNTIPPTPVLTDFRILNNLVEPGQPFGKRIILDRVISECKSIELSYRENTFSLEFSGLSYNLPEKNIYSYMLEGVDEDWVTVTSARRFASYTKLPGGEYTFLLRSANNDGLWNEEPIKLGITITPPFWRTGWFRILLIIATILLIGIYLHLHTRSLQLQKRRLEQLVTERTALIEDQKVQLEQQNTEILEQRDRLIELNRKVKAAHQLKLKFFTNISHEFRTPLTLIMGPLQKLSESWKTNKEASQALDLIRRNTDRLLHLINQLMDFRKIEKGKMSLHVRKGDLDGYIKNILEAFKDLSTEKNIELEYYTAPAQNETWFDHEKLENILYNLLSNAIKYTPEGGRIKVSLRFKKGDKSDKQGFDKAYIEVADTGVGISKEKLPYIFKRFYQADQINDGSMGSGIGLSLTRDLLKVHRGSISVESEPGVGTCFTLKFPHSRDAYSESEITNAEIKTTTLSSQVDVLKSILQGGLNSDVPELELQHFLNKESILVVEDNRELREFVASRLNQEYNILLAENGEIALQLAEKHNPDLIISDIMMPVMDGLELCRHIKNKIETSHIPFILLTAKGTIENQIEGLRIGADDYLPKPFNIELLETRAQNLIDSRKRLRAAYAKDEVDILEELADNPTDQKFLKEALEQIEKNIDNTEFTVTDFASVMCVSRSLLHKKLTALTDQSATDFINTVRLKKSKELMLSGSYNISEVAYAVGYNDPKYYSRLFKKHFSVSPSEYIKQLRSKAG